MSHEWINDLCYSVRLPSGRVVTNPSGFDSEVPEDFRRSTPYPDIVYSVMLPGGRIVTGPSHFPDNQLRAQKP